MVDDRQLSSVLSEFAYTLATDFSIASILDHLVRQIVEIVPVTSAGVTLIQGGGDPHHVAASDESALRFERLQATFYTQAEELGTIASMADAKRRWARTLGAQAELHGCSAVVGP